MGTRLYPSTKKTENLEILAGVPAGTTLKFEELEAKFKGDEDGFYDEIFKEENRELNILHSFLLNGWGKLNTGSYYLIEKWGMDPVCGEVSEPLHVKGLLFSKEILVNSELCEGLYWS
jgi:hypothetical protein